MQRVNRAQSKHDRDETTVHVEKGHVEPGRVKRVQERTLQARMMQ